MPKKIHLVLTVGKNPLPVWVAWDRLTGYWKDLEHEVAVQFVYTPGSKDEKERLRGYCTTAGATVRADIETDARSPNMNDIKNQIVSALGPDFTDLHVHYTGGTQAMGVVTVGAMLLVRQERQIDLDASYLDPGRGIPPAITSSPAIVSWDGRLLIDDTREGIDANLIQIAKLNGFRTGPFEFYGRDNQVLTCSAPDEPNDKQLMAGAAVLNNYRGNIESQFRDNFPKNLHNPWWTTFHPNSFESKRKNDDFVYPNSGGTVTLRDATDIEWEEQILPAINAAYPVYQWDTNARTLDYPAMGTATDDQKNTLEKMDRFFTGHWLEYAAYAAFKQVLEDIGRGNFELYHNVYVTRELRGVASRYFELDVVAVLGYQVVVVSCSVTNRKDDIKQKAMEAYHRAKQIGGDEARAVVLCVASNEDARLVERELEDETGTHKPLQVWGRDQGRYAGEGPVPNMDSLRSKFRELCNDLCWN